MKLHLPLSLRAALLGCFAAAALVTPAAADLTWDPANSTWAVDEPFASDGTGFRQGDDVTFGPLNGADGTVTLQGALEVGKMIVDAESGDVYTFSGSAEASITSLTDLTIMGGTAGFSSSQVLPEGAKVDVYGGGKMKLNTGDDNTGDDLCNLNLTLGGAGNGAAVLELEGSNSMTVLGGSLTMKDGSILRLSNTAYYPWFEMKGDLTVEGTVTVDMAAGMAALNISGSYQGDGTIRITGESTWSMISLRAPGRYNLILDCIDAEVSLNENTYANIVIPEGRAGGVSFAGGRASADVRADGEFYMYAVSNDVIIKSLSGSGTALASQGTLILEDGDFSGPMQVGETWQFSDATLVLGSSDAMSKAESVDLAGGASCVASLALADGVESATLKKLTGTQYSRLQAGTYRVTNGGSFAGTLDDGVTLTLGSGSVMNLNGARAADAAAASIVGEGGSTIRNLTLGAGLTLGASLSAGDAPVILDQVTLADGGTIRLASVGSSEEASSLLSFTASGNMASSLSAGESVLLALGDDVLSSLVTDQDYVLISDLGTGVDADCFRLNYADAGSSQFKLRVADGDLVLAVLGDQAKVLTWNGGIAGFWNAEEGNTVWLSEGESVAFSTYDRVIFGTQDGVARASVQVDAAGVTSGAITVVGTTSYVMDGGPISTAELSGAGLTVGTPDELFKGTLTLRSANNWDGDTVINSGTVEVQDAQALSDTTVQVKSGAMLLLDFGAEESLAAAVDLEGGTVAAGAAGASVDRLAVGAAGGLLDGQAGALSVSVTSAAAGAELFAAGEVELRAAGAEEVLSLGSLDLVKDADVPAHVSVDCMELGSLFSEDADARLEAADLTLTGTGSLMAGTVQASVLRLGSASATAGSVSALLGHLTVGSLCYSFLQAEAPLTLGSYGAVEENAAIGIELTSRALAAGNGTYSLLGLSGEGAADELAVADFTLTAETLERLGSNGEAVLQVSEDGQSLQVVLSGLVPEAHYYERLMGSAASMNGLAGLRLADAALVSQRVQPGGDLDALMDSLDAAIAAGDMGAADRVAAQLSGASATVLGMAFANEAQQRLASIRNRLAMMGADELGAPAADPASAAELGGALALGAWVNAEGGYRHMRQSGTAPGYSLSSWGGTLGVETSQASWRAGLAMTVLWGDLDADSCESASGDWTTWYLSAFGAYRSGAWSHTLVGSLGLADMSLDRTVSHGAGSYRTSGDTNGTSLGLLYELAYDVRLNESSTALLQPLVNVSYVHASVDGYTERGSDAALRVDRQGLESLSMSLGARVQALGGEAVMNRSALFEGRVLAKFNAGDRRNTVGVGLANGVGRAAVESAQVGVFGVELGAGVSVPLGEGCGSVFADVSAEFYREYSSVDASVGYRLRF